MGVTGLWRLIEPSGKPVPLETLENKTLAVDVSIWLHQAIKGFQDSQGAAVPNAHLLGIYHRVCKLLYFQVKPILVFDGGVPNLKKDTITKRYQQKSKKLSEADSIQKQLLTTLIKHSAVNKVLTEHVKASLSTKIHPTKSPTKTKSEDIYKLPPTETSSLLSSEDESSDESPALYPSKHWDLHTIDEKSPHFKSLPADVRHDILTELKETRKQSSWGKIHEMPKKSDEFSGFQMKRLLKRYSVQVSLEEAEKEMGGRTMSLAELEAILKDQGVVTSDSIGHRIASNEHTKFLLIKDVKKAMDEAQKNQSSSNKEPDSEVVKVAEVKDNSSSTSLFASTKNPQSEVEDDIELNFLKETHVESNKAEVEFQKDLETAIQLSLQDVPSTSKENYESHNFTQDEHSTSKLNKNGKNKDVLSSAKNYMMEYSGLTPNEIEKIINGAHTSNETVGTKNNFLSTIPETCEEAEDTQKSNGLQELQDIQKTDVVSKIEEPVLKIPDTATKEENLHDDEVEVISNPDSSSSEDFLEVSEATVEKSEPGLEIVFKPEVEIEDDIFKDIFCKEEAATNHQQISTTSITELQTSDVIQVESISTSSNAQNPISADKPKETEAAHKIETKRVVEELLQQTEETGNDKPDMQDSAKISTEQLAEIEKKLEKEKDELLTERLSKERLANNPTDQIYQEAQELLQLFGVPYIVAPMEAEAQCAFLEMINLTDGTITDDSDVWLFGGKTVYKNFFNQQKLVLEFRSENILHHFKLTREQMILLALLVGSDYTIGLQGVGPVTALEILAAFPPSSISSTIETGILSGLFEFRKWIMGGKAVGPGRTALRSKLKNVTIPDSFPSLQVIKAYLEPSIDTNEEPFTWSKPDINGLIEFAKQKFGWARVKSEEILKPVLKRLNENRIQKSIKNYFQSVHKVDSGETVNMMSARVKRAVTKIGGGNVEEVSEKPKRKRTAKATKKIESEAGTSKDSSNKVGDENGQINEKSKRKKTAKDTKETKSKRQTSKDLPPTSKDTAEGFSSDEDIQFLEQTKRQSKKKLVEINEEIKQTLEQEPKKKLKPIPILPKKDVIPQKEKDKIYALRSKLKAIEVFRKSKQGPGFVKKRTIVKQKQKDDSYLSESSSDS